MRAMRAIPQHAPAAAPERGERRSDLQNLRALFPYLWAFRGRVVLAVGCLVLGKLAVVGVPILLKGIVDALAPRAAAPLAVVPIALVVAYGALRLATSLFNELREFFFSRVTQAA